MNSPADGRKRIFPDTNTKFPIVSPRHATIDSDKTKRRFSTLKERSSILKKKDMYDLDTVDDFDPYKTTSSVFFSPTPASARNTGVTFYKKKTPFTQFVNASYAGGVFFNPPVAGL
jgi:hypothetical protein